MKCEVQETVQSELCCQNARVYVYVSDVFGT